VAWAQQHRDATLAAQEVAVLGAVRRALPDKSGRRGAAPYDQPRPGRGAGAAALSRL
jgi:hypothetical protein